MTTGTVLLALYALGLTVSAVGMLAWSYWKKGRHYRLDDVAKEAVDRLVKDSEHLDPVCCAVVLFTAAGASSIVRVSPNAFGEAEPPADFRPGRAVLDTLETYVMRLPCVRRVDPKHH